MKVTELINEMAGRAHGHPGYGRGMFSRRHYFYTADAVIRIDDAEIRDHVTHWLSNIFSRDNPSFQPSRFESFIAKGKPNGNFSPEFQQRHFHYFAGEIAKEQDPEIKEWLANWLGGIAGRTNSGFKQDRWNKFCGVGSSEA
jgi:hypothetical protein